MSWLVLQPGIDINAVDVFGSTPLEEATAHNRTVVRSSSHVLRHPAHGSAQAARTRRQWRC